MAAGQQRRADSCTTTAPAVPIPAISSAMAAASPRTPTTPHPAHAAPRRYPSSVIDPRAMPIVTAWPSS